jgi:hypothetical protein
MYLLSIPSSNTINLMGKYRIRTLQTPHLKPNEPLPSSQLYCE